MGLGYVAIYFPKSFYILFIKLSIFFLASSITLSSIQFIVLRKIKDGSINPTTNLPFLFNKLDGFNLCFYIVKSYLLLYFSIFNDFLNVKNLKNIMY